MTENVKKTERILSNGSEIAVVEDWVTSNYGGIPFVSFGESPLLPDPVDTVIEVDID